MRRLQSGPTDRPFLPLVPILSEINDLKRITSAGHEGSIATRLFAQGWSELAGGTPLEQVCWRITGQALAAARLGDIDRGVLRECGVPDEAATAILVRAAEAAGGPLFRASENPVSNALAAGGPPSTVGPPGFVAKLARQPRAGVTCPGKPRILLEPPENHAEHCVIVAVYGALLAPFYEADPARVFLAAMSHHFHNSGMPDSGFSGEVLLGAHLDAVMAHFNALCLAELDEPLRAQVEAARAVLPNDRTAEGRAFHAADVLDRVLQIVQFTRAASLTPEQMLGEMELVHDGPVKGFQDDVLRQAGLL